MAEKSDQCDLHCINQEQFSELNKNKDQYRNQQYYSQDQEISQLSEHKTQSNNKQIDNQNNISSNQHVFQIKHLDDMKQWFLPDKIHLQNEIQKFQTQLSLLQLSQKEVKLNCKDAFYQVGNNYFLQSAEQIQQNIVNDVVETQIQFQTAKDKLQIFVQAQDN